MVGAARPESCAVIYLIEVRFWPWETGWGHVAGAAQPESCAVIYVIEVRLGPLFPPSEGHGVKFGTWLGAGYNQYTCRDVS